MRTAFFRHASTVTSMRNKANRLEELFVRLIESNPDGGAKVAA